MIDWLFRKKRSLARTGAAPAADAAPLTPRAEPAPATPAAVDWRAALAAAAGDDDALLAIVRAAAPVDVRLAAVGALASEDALKRAEHDLRKGDRRVHRLARQRHAALVAQREARRRASELTDAARAMLDDPLIAANRLVEIDRAWHALDAALLEPAQTAEFDAVFTRLGALARERADRALALDRWDAAARDAHTALRSACMQAAASAIDPAALAASAAQAQATLDAAPADAPGTAQRAAALRDALTTSAAVALRLDLLDALQHAPARSAAAAAAQAHDAPRAEAAQPMPVHAAPDETASDTAPAGAASDAAPATPPDGAASETTYDAPPDGATSDAARDVPPDGAASNAARDMPPEGAASDAAPATPPDGAASGATHDALPERAASNTVLVPPPDGAASDATPNTLPGGADSSATADALRRWRELAPLADADLARALDARLLQIERALQPAPPARRAERAKKAGAPSDASANAAAIAQLVAQLVAQIEAALAEGRLGDAAASLAQVDALARNAALPASLRARIDRVHAEAVRLRGWQQWGGSRARDELVAQAEALAAAGADSPDPALARLTTRQRAELIGELRARWKELDRHGGASPRALWQRFDAALTTAYAPVAAQADAQRAARTQNLQARIELLAALEAVALPGDGAREDALPTAGDAGAAQPAGHTADRVDVAAAVAAPGPGAQAAAAASAAAPHAAGLAAALAEFHSAWRKLGPIEHTVPRAEREPLQARLDAAVARVERPLREARRVAQAQRERLVAQARELAAANNEAPSRDAIDKARALQAQWQQAAHALPLARAVEAALWSDFRGAIDAIYAARDAEIAARDAARDAQHDAREALIARLDAIAQAPGADALRDAERALAEIDAQWRSAGPAPRESKPSSAPNALRGDRAGAAMRARGADLEARYRAAHAAARERIADAELRRWHAQCDALAARLAERDAVTAQLAEADALTSRRAESDTVAAGAVEPDAPAAHTTAGDGARSDAAGPGVKAPARPALPAPWERALARRTAAPRADAIAGDELLLRLEAALGIESPPAFGDARRALKLQAMKAALEGRHVGAAPAAHELLAEALARGTFDAGQRARLRAAVAGMRGGAPLRVDR